MTAQKSIFIALDGSSNGTVPKGARLALGGLIEHDGSADPLSPKLGVLEDTFTPVVVGKANMSYDVRAAVFVTNPTGSAANGPTVGANDAVVNVATTPAPGSNARYDVVWVRQHVVAADGGADSDNILEFGVTQGSVAASPSVPVIPTGALALANVLVTSGTTATNTLTFTRAHNWVRARGAGGALRESIVITAAGSVQFHKADYPWLRAVRSRLQAPAGGSGAASTTNASQGSAGDGSGGGGYSEKLIAVEDLLDSETVTLGSPGAAGTPSVSAGAGGNASFGAHHSANGGGAGGIGTPASNAVANINSGTGGAGGTAAGGDINIPGGAGTSGESVWNSSRARGGRGGDSQMGRGAVGNTTGTRAAGLAGGNYGGGASGGACTASQTGINGAAGAPGIIILELFG